MAREVSMINYKALGIVSRTVLRALHLDFSRELCRFSIRWLRPDVSLSCGISAPHLGTDMKKFCCFPWDLDSTKGHKCQEELAILVFLIIAISPSCLLQGVFFKLLFPSLLGPSSLHRANFSLTFHFTFSNKLHHCFFARFIQYFAQNEKNLDSNSRRIDEQPRTW